MRKSLKIAGPVVGVAIAAGAFLVGSATAQPASPTPTTGPAIFRLLRIVSLLWTLPTVLVGS